MFSPTLGTLNSYVIFPLNSVLPLLFNTCSYKAPQPEHFQPGLLGGSMRVQYYLSFLLSHDKNFSPEQKGVPRTKGHSIPLITLRDFVFTPNRAHPAMTYGYEQPSLARYARVLKVAAYGMNEQV